jgi:sugar (pentulose or hexulose) kinase
MMLALKDHAFDGTSSPTEFYIGECFHLDWFQIAQQRQEARYQKAKSLRHMRRYTTANILGRLVIAISDACSWLFREKPEKPSPV